MRNYIRFSLSAFALFALSGCAPQAKPDFQDLNLSKNSSMVENEKMRMATAILIKKSRDSDMTFRSMSGMNQKQLEMDSILSKMNLTIADLMAKISILSEETSQLKEQVVLLSAKTTLQTSKIEKNDITTSQDNKPALIQSKAENTQVTVPKVISIPMPKDKTVRYKNREDKKERKEKKQSVKAECSPKSETILPITEQPKVQKTLTPNGPKNQTNNLQGNDMNQIAGKIIVNRNTYTYKIPENDAAQKSQRIKEGEVLEYVGYNDKWYKLKSGEFVKATSSINLSDKK